MTKLSITLIFALSVSICLSQNTEQFCNTFFNLQKVVFEQHYQPKTINDSLSSGVYRLFLEALDTDKDFYLQQDINLFEADKLSLDDYILNQDCSFITKYSDSLQNRITANINYLKTLKNVTLDYNNKYKLQFIPNQAYSFYQDKNQQEIGLQKRIAYKTLSRLLDEYEDIAYIQDNFKTLESALKPKIIDNEICLLSELLNKPKGFDNYVYSLFLNAYLKYQDPNSTYFSNSEKTIYEDGLSSNQLSFGILTDKNDNGQIVVAQIIPGSAAFINGNIEVDDIIISLTSKTQTLETFCVSNDDIAAFTTNQNNNEITFKVKKSNGKTLNVKLKKSKIKVEENALTGYIISKDSLKFGYIELPSFYTNEDSPNGRGLTLDFSKELYKLKKENIEGLVIDLRFNGGGSMQEAIDLCGMFIDRGPVSIVEANNNKKYTLKDTNRGVLLKKPLVILVNNYTASASEFFASAMQDYNRAVIVGSKTHGKSSAQAIMPLSETEDLGYCKLTVEAFFRVTGKSLQSKGVIPDILLPSLYDNLGNFEADIPFALKNKNTYVTLKHFPYKKFDVDQLAQKSKARQSLQALFKQVENNNKKLYSSIFEKGEPYTLSLEQLKQNQDNKIKFYDTIFTIPTVKNPIKVSNTQATTELLLYNKSNQEDNKNLILNLSKDLYVNEAFFILQDIIKNKP